MVDGFPKPLIFWKTASGYRVPRSYVKVSENGDVVLIFKRVSKVLGGKYTCVGINAAGKTELIAKLDVKGTQIFLLNFSSYFPFSFFGFTLHFYMEYKL